MVVPWPHGIERGGRPLKRLIRLETDGREGDPHAAGRQPAPELVAVCVSQTKKKSGDYRMRNLFRGYYHATEMETAEIWRTAAIALDANVLLSLYKVSPTTSSLYLSALEGRREQGWLPYQAAFEFHQNVHGERARQTAGHTERIQTIRTFLDALRKTAIKSRLEKSELQVQAVEKLELLLGELEQQKTAISSATHHNKNDELLSRIAALYDERVGVEPTQADLAALREQGQKRFEDKIPPGFEDDKSKQGPEKYGDFILWHQLMTYAKEESQNIIFVTDDDKSDWWLKNGKTSLAARPELIQEFRKETGQEILIYNSQQFYHELLGNQATQPQQDPQAIRAAADDMGAAVKESQWVEAIENKQDAKKFASFLSSRDEYERLIRATRQSLLQEGVLADDPQRLGSDERIESELSKAKARYRGFESEYFRLIAGAEGASDFETAENLRDKMARQKRVIAEITKRLSQERAWLDLALRPDLERDAFDSYDGE